MRFIKNKSFRKFSYVILFFIGIFNFPYLGLLFLVFLILALMFDSGGKDAFKKDLPQNKNLVKERKGDEGQGYEDPALQKWREHRKEFEKEFEKLKTESYKDADYSKLKSMAESIPSLLEDVQTPKTFFEVIGDLTMKTRTYYFQEIDKSNPVKGEYPFLEDDFVKAKDVCDRYFDGNEYVKVWVIYRTLLQRQVPEEKINKNFPELVSKLKYIRDQEWKYIAWAYYIAEEVEKVTGKDSCTKERYKYVEEIFAKDDLKKERILDNQSDEFKNDHKLLRKFDLEEVKAKDKEISEEFLRNFNVEKFGGKPNKIKSLVKWEIDETVKFGEKVREDFLDLPMLNGLGFDTSELNQKNLQFAGKIRTKNYYSIIFGDNFLDQIQDLERVSDFYQFEMFDKDPINTAIKNEDIERIILYSLLQIPKKTILIAENISKDDPLKRAPYFGIMQIHHLIILQVLQDLEIHNKKEIVIASWIANQFVDPLDGGDAMDAFLKTPNKGRYDDKFMREIWVPLYYLLSSEFNLSKKSRDSTKVIDVADGIFQSVLNSYYLGNSEEAYAMMKPMYEYLQEEEKKRSK